MSYRAYLGAIGMVGALAMSTLCAQAQTPRAGDSVVPGSRPFVVATRVELLAARVPLRLIHSTIGELATVTLEEKPRWRWNSSQGSYPQFVAKMLRAGGDSNARYLGKGKIEITGGPRLLSPSMNRTTDSTSRSRGPPVISILPFPR